MNLITFIPKEVTARMKIKSFIFSLVATALLLGTLGVAAVQAQAPGVPAGGDFNSVQVDAPTTNFDTGAGSGLAGVVQRVINAILIIIGIIAVIFIIIGGIRYIASQGDEDQTAQAKNTILYAVIGIVVVLVAGAIVNFVMNTVGQ